MNAGHAARAGRGARPDRTPVIPSAHHHVLAFSVRLSPRVLVTWVFWLPAGTAQTSGSPVTSALAGHGEPPVPRARA